MISSALWEGQRICLGGWAGRTWTYLAAHFRDPSAWDTASGHAHLLGGHNWECGHLSVSVLDTFTRKWIIHSAFSSLSSESHKGASDSYMKLYDKFYNRSYRLYDRIISLMSHEWIEKKLRKQVFNFFLFLVPPRPHRK